MLERYSIIGLVFALTLIFTDIMLLRKRKISGKTFVFWFVVGFSTGVVSLTPFLISIPAAVFGAEYSISAIVAMGFSFFLLMFFYLHYKISELNSQLMKLAMQISVANYDKQHSERTETKDSDKRSD